MISNLICRELINANYNQDINLFKEKQSYQKGIYLVADFGSAFKKALGETPHSYLIKIRISKAKVLLETTDYSLSDIAQKIGFKKASSFTSQFKASTGIRPSKYREKSKKQY